MCQRPDSGCLPESVPRGDRASRTEGGGRSELLQAIYGLDRLVRGEICLDNQPVRISSRPRPLSRIALVPENRREQVLVLDFSVEENMIMPIFQRLTSGLRVSARAEPVHCGEVH